MSSTTAQITLINLEPSTTAYVIWVKLTANQLNSILTLYNDAVNGFNYSYNQIKDLQITEPASFMYNGKNTPDDINSQSIMTDGNSYIAFIWSNINPVTSPDVISNAGVLFNDAGDFAVTNFSRNRQMGYIVQAVNNSGNAKYYYTFTERPLYIINNTNFILEAQAERTNSTMVTLTQATYPSSTAMTDTRTQLISIASGSIGELPATSIFNPNAYVYIWRGAQRISATAEYAAVVQTYNYALLDSAHVNPPVMTVNIINNIWTITDTSRQGGNDGTYCSSNGQCKSRNCVEGVCAPKLQLAGAVNGAVCNVDDDCASRRCINGICTARTGCKKNCTEYKIEWWVWAVIIIGAIIALLLFIWILHEAANTKSEVKIM
jgi:hypothetical protein